MDEEYRRRPVRSSRPLVALHRRHTGQEHPIADQPPIDIDRRAADTPDTPDAVLSRTVDVADTVLPMILPRIERIRWSETRLGQLVELLDRFHRDDRDSGDDAALAGRPSGPT